MTTYTFKVVVEPDEDRWRAYCPALEEQGAATWGYTREEARQHVREVLEMIVAELVEDGKPVPANVAVSEASLRDQRLPNRWDDLAQITVSGAN
ncbi:MAG TPA: type II toxin-antitoxin system HicB family antitoxin, partial [Stellaceae bacterium]